MNRDTSAWTLSGARQRARGARRNQSERTELQLLQTATQLFSERGFHGTGIRDIADAAGLAVSAMYYYASSKDELLIAIMEGGLSRLIDGSGAVLADIEGPSERLARLVAFHVTFHALNPKTARVVDQEFTSLDGPARAHVLELRDAYESVWTKVMEDGALAGEFEDRGSLGRLAVLQMCTGVAYWYRADGAFSPAQLGVRFADMSLALMGAVRDAQPVSTTDLAIEVVPAADLVAMSSEPGRLTEP